MVHCNINETVRFMLTQHGKEILDKHLEELNRWNAGIKLDAKMYKYGCYPNEYQMPLWELCTSSVPSVIWDAIR